MAAAAQAKEQPSTPTIQEKPPTPIVEVPNSLKIIEQGDDETTAESSPKSSPSSEIIPPPPPEFANETLDDETEQISQNSSKESLQEFSAEDGEIKVQFRSSGGRVPVAAAMAHQDVRRSISVDDKSSSSASSPTVLSNKLNTSTIAVNQLLINPIVLPAMSIK